MGTYSTERAHLGLYSKQNVIGKEITEGDPAALSKPEVSKLAKLYIKELLCNFNMGELLILIFHFSTWKTKEGTFEEFIQEQMHLDILHAWTVWEYHKNMKNLVWSK